MDHHFSERHRDSYDQHVLREAITTMFFPLHLLILIAALPVGLIVLTTVGRAWTATALGQWWHQKALYSDGVNNLATALFMTEFLAGVALLALPCFLAGTLLAWTHGMVQRFVARGLWGLRGPTRTGYSRDFNPIIIVLLPFLSRVIIFAVAIAAVIVLPTIWVWFLGP